MPDVLGGSSDAVGPGGDVLSGPRDVLSGSSDALGGGGGSTQFSDDFNRANGSVGPNWTAGSVGTDTALTISSNTVVGTGVGLPGSIIRTAEAYGDDHYSEITVTSSMAVNNWIGPAVRMQANAGTLYGCIYFNNGGIYVLELFKRVAGTYTTIDLAVAGGTGNVGYTLPGPLSAGDRVRLNVAGNELTVILNGTRVTKVIDATIPSGGAPGVISFGATAAADAWTGAKTVAEFPSALQIFTTSPPNSANNGGGKHIRVLVPTNPNLAKPHNFMYVLPVSPDITFDYGNPLDTMYAFNIHNAYNLTLIEPNFNVAPWYINTSNPGGFPSYMHEDFMVNDIVPWTTSHYSTSGTEKHWLLGFSKSGWGGFNLLMRHPTVFAKGAFWDWPYGEVGSALPAMGLDANYGNAAYLDANYVQNSAFLDLYKTPFQSTKRIWIGGYSAFQTDVAAADTALTGKGMLHDYANSLNRQHSWSSGWPVDAVAALSAMP